MSGTKDSRHRAASDRGTSRTLQWGAMAAVLAVMPKCLLCVLGYLALATGARVELCGGAPRRWELSQLVAPILAVGAVGTTGGKAGLPSAMGPSFSGR